MSADAQELGDVGFHFDGIGDAGDNLGGVVVGEDHDRLVVAIRVGLCDHENLGITVAVTVELLCARHIAGFSFRKLITFAT